VVPIFRDGKVIGEIDVDGNKVAAFNQTDRILLEWIAEKLGRLSTG
jgi:GAF domain-containing protein